MAKFGEDQATPELTIGVNDGVAHSKNPRKCAYHVTFDLDLDVEHTWMQAYLETIVCKFGCDPAICLGVEAIFVPAQKFPYHVTFDLDLDIEHILHADLESIL